MEENIQSGLAKVNAYISSLPDNNERNRKIKTKVQEKFMELAVGRDISTEGQLQAIVSEIKAVANTKGEKPEVLFAKQMLNYIGRMGLSGDGIYGLIRVKQPQNTYYPANSDWHYVYVLHAHNVATPIKEYEYAIIKSNISKVMNEDSISGTLANKVMDTIAVNIPENNIYDKPDNKLIYLGGDCYYNVEESAIVPSSDMEKTVCFRRLFDTDRETSDVPLVDASYISIDLIKQAADDIFESWDGYLKTGEFDVPEYLVDTFYEWGDEKSYRTADMLLAMSSILTRRNLHGMVFLIGQTRNGKSTFLNLIETILGTNNVANISMAQLGDPHTTGNVQGVMANLCDEVGDFDKTDIASFKRIADNKHGSQNQLFSSKAPVIYYDFPNFMCMNNLPDWTKTDGKSSIQACLNRTIPLLFYHNFEGKDTEVTSESFEQRTYNETFLSYVVGALIGTESYLRECKKLPWSEELTNYRTTLKDNQLGWQEYIKDFRKEFFGYMSPEFVHSDCINWCRAMERESGIRYTYPTVEQLKMALDPYYKDGGAKTKMSYHGKDVRCYREENFSTNSGGRYLFEPNMPMPKVGRLVDVDTAGEYISNREGSLVHLIRGCRNSHTPIGDWAGKRKY